MKLKSLYSFLLATALVACNEDFNEGIAGVQTADPESPAAAISFSATAASATTIDLGALAEGTTTVKICSFTATPSTETTTVTHVLDLRDAENNSYDIDLNANGEASVADLQTVIEAVYNKRPVERTFDAYVYEFLNTDGQSLIGKSEKITVVMTPKAPVIETAYYLIGGMNNWTADNADALIKLSHSGQDVYDDPVFSTIIEVSDACYWKVIPQSVVDKLKNGEIANVWEDETNILGGAGEDGNTALTGALTIGSKSAMQIEEGGWVKISLDMMEYTYKVEMLGNVTPYLYVVGDHIDGWNPALASYIYSPDFKSYYGYANLNSSFKLTSEQSWNGINYGYASDTTMSTDGGAGNLWVAAPGFYYIQADITAMTWAATEITTYGLIGDATEGGWDASTPMTFDAATSTYTVTTTLKEGTFKFRANNGWDINLGGDPNNLTHNGDNINVPEGAGTYTITLDLSDAANLKATVVKQ